MKESKKSDNSILCIADQNLSVSTASFGLYFRVGSLYESEINCGITHLTEHLFFRRLNGLSNKDLYYLMESIGGAIRGYTTAQYVCFELTVLSEFARSAFELMNEFLKSFNWSDEEVEAEKRIILNEIAQIGNNTDCLSAAQMGNDSFLLPVKGTPDSLKRISAKDVNEWKNKFFNCGNCCFAVTGNISDPDLSDIYSSLKEHKSNVNLPQINLIPPTAYNRSLDDLIFCGGDENYADVFICFDVDFSLVDWTNVMIMFDAFCNGDGSKLSFAMKDERGMVYEIDSKVKEYGTYGNLTISWSIQDERLIESLKLFFDLLKEFKSGITEEEFKSSIVFSTLNMRKYYDNPSDLNNMYGYYDFIAGLPFSVEDSVNKFNTITKELINSASQTIFRSENMFIEIDFNKEHISDEYLKKMICLFASDL